MINPFASSSRRLPESTNAKARFGGTRAKGSRSCAFRDMVTQGQKGRPTSFVYNEIDDLLMASKDNRASSEEGGRMKEVPSSYLYDTQ